MNIDLELILVIGVVVTGVIWFAYALRHRRRYAEATAGEGRVGAAGTGDRMPWYVEYSRSFFPVLLIVLVLRSFIAEPFRIPSGSMMPTLLVGDFILVNKFAYGVRLPVLNAKIIETGEPARGDVAVFRFPNNPSDDYIKRIVGLPGDRISYENRVLYINGEPMKQSAEGAYTGVGTGKVMTGAEVRAEHIEDVNHEILVQPGRFNMRGEWFVPEGHYFVMGDNRDNSNDSRFWGFVPEENLVGKAFIIWLNWDINGKVFDVGRIGNAID